MMSEGVALRSQLCAFCAEGVINVARTFAKIVSSQWYPSWWQSDCHVSSGYRI